MSGENERLRRELKYLSKLIRAHKKSVASHDQSEGLASSSAAKVADVSTIILKEEPSSVCKVSCSEDNSSGTQELSVLPAQHTSAELSNKSPVTKQGNIEQNKSVKAEGIITSASSSHLLCVANTGPRESLSHRQHEVLGDMNNVKVSDVRSAIAADMVKLYRSKVLNKNISTASVPVNDCPSTDFPLPESCTTIDSSHSARDISLSDSSSVKLKRTVVTKLCPSSKTQFKLVNCETVRSQASCDKMLLPLDSKPSLRVITHFGQSAIDGRSDRIVHSTRAATYSQQVSLPNKVPQSATFTMPSAFSVSKTTVVQVVPPASNVLSALLRSSSYRTVSSCNSMAHRSNATSSVAVISNSKYKIVRNRELKNGHSCSRTLVTPPASSRTMPFVANRTAKHTPTLLVVNKYKLIRKKRRSLTSPSTKMPDVAAKSDNRATPVMPHNPLSTSASGCNKYKLVRNNKQQYSSPVKKPARTALQSTSNRTKERVQVRSKYKLVRRKSCSVTPVSATSTPVVTTARSNLSVTPVKKPARATVQPTSYRANERVQVRSKYKLVRRKSSTSVQTPVRAMSTPLVHTAQLTQSSRSLPHRHFMPPLFLNKYKLIRRRARLKNDAVKYSMMHASRLPVRHGWKISADRYKAGSSRKPYASFAASTAYKKTRKRNSSFLSKYALRRSGVGNAEYRTNRHVDPTRKRICRSRYKFVRGSVNPQHKSCHRMPLPHKSQLKIDRRTLSARRASGSRRRALAQSASSVYKWQRKAATPVINRRPSLRLSFSAEKRNGISSGSTTTLYQRKTSWMHWSAADQRKKLATETKQYCMYFNRFGRCSRGDACKYIHDPDKVSVCTRFLRGTCKVTDCPFSHHVAPHKMPTCRYFLRGICNRDDCPYRHVNVASDAEICIDFARGYCSLADSCKKKHLTVCPEFTDTGSCPRGKRCPLRHIAKNRRQLVPAVCTSSIDNSVSPPVKKLKSDEEADDIMLPLRQRRLPSYIAISNTTPDTDTKSSNAAVMPDVQEKLVIRPRLAPLSTSHDLSWLLDP